MLRVLLRSAMCTLAMGAIVLGGVTVAQAASPDCTGTIKWNGSVEDPEYLWSDGPLCPSTTCNDPQYSCLREVGFPVPPEEPDYRQWCDCGGDPDPESTCTTVVYYQRLSGGPTITGVECDGDCTNEVCELVPGAKDGNGMYYSQCKCN